MDAFLEFFAKMPSWQKLVWIVSCLSLHWIIESFLPLFKHEYRKLRHARTNLLLLVCSIIINALFGAATIVLCGWIAANQFGLLHLVNWPTWVELLVALALFDFFGQYVVHYLLHKVKFMWRFHMIHHSDTHVDATTGTRHHPGDYFMREVFALGVIVLLGVPFAFYMVYRIASVFFAYFTHANISLPGWLDKSLHYVIVTPNMHKFHHHFERPWTDTNYGNIFSIWDRVFGTLVYADASQIRYGLDVLDDSTDEDLMFQFKIPFDKSIKTDS